MASNKAIIKTFLVIFSLFIGISSGRVIGFRNGANPANPLSEVIVGMKMRELIAVDALLDYDKPMPNPRHEKGRPGGSGR